MHDKTPKKIAISEQNYLGVKKLGSAGHASESDQIKQIQKPTIVTICLTNTHEECTGNYVDTTYSFRIQCKCRCHLSRRINWELRK
jgi:hypothetical protein